MNENVKKVYDLEQRTFLFTKKVMEYIKELPKGITNSEIGKQLMRSSSSIGANYIEANESLSKKDFIMLLYLLIVSIFHEFVFNLNNLFFSQILGVN